MAFLAPILTGAGSALVAGLVGGGLNYATKKAGKYARQIDDDFGEGFESGMNGYLRTKLPYMEGLGADRDGNRDYEYLYGEHGQSKRNQMSDYSEGYDELPNRDYRGEPEPGFYEQAKRFVKKGLEKKRDKYIKRWTEFAPEYEAGEGRGEGRKLVGDIRGAWSDLQRLKRDWQSYDPPEDFPDRGGKRRFPGVDNGTDKLKAVLRALSGGKRKRKGKGQGERQREGRMGPAYPSAVEALNYMRERQYRKLKRHARSRSFRYGPARNQNYGPRRRKQREEKQKQRLERGCI